MKRLRDEALAALPGEIERPFYDRGAVGTGVVHLGIGAFHRAHQALVFDRALEAGDRRWGITGASLRSPDVRDRLTPQDGLYSLIERDGTAERIRVVGSVRQVLVAPEAPSRLVAALASPDTHIVSLTVTEKGYKVDPVSGALLADDREVAADLGSLAAPRTAPGFVAAGLAARFAAGLPPFTAISCDNLPGNGARLRGAVLAIAAAHDPALAAWIEAEGAFPATMVDRIVPAPSGADFAAAAAALGFDDQAAVVTEPYLQWVIEDRFCGPRPDFAAVGVQLTQDVAPWEEAKLRLLNGAHSAIAYLGELAGISYVHQFIRLPEGRRFVERLWDEVAETLSPPPGLDLVAYRSALMRRFANPSLRHRTGQIAMDGSQKLPQRLIAPLLSRSERGQPSECLTLAIAAWMHWLSGTRGSGRRHSIDDALAHLLAEKLAAARTGQDRVLSLLSLRQIFPKRLSEDPSVVDALVAKLRLLEDGGVMNAIKLLV